MPETAYNLAIAKIREGLHDLGRAKRLPLGEVEITIGNSVRHIFWLNPPQEREYRVDIKFSLDERSV